jgi:hypothetical protein
MGPTKVCNQTARSRIENVRKIDEDGFLRCTLRVLKEGVFPYKISELPGEMKVELAGRDEIGEFIPASEFTEEVFDSLEGKPIIINARDKGHEWQTADEEELVDTYQVGAVAGRPRMMDKDIVIDAIITDADTIEKIENKQLVECSAAYDSETELIKGTYGDKTYDAVQKNLRMNHILLLPEGRGRCGHKVRILNKEASIMFVLNRKNKKGVERTYNFSTDADMKEGQRILNDNEMDNEGEMTDAKKSNDNEMTKLNELIRVRNEEIAAHKAKISDLEKELGELHEQLKGFSDEEQLEKEGELRKQQENDESSVIAANIPPEKKAANEAEMEGAWKTHARKCDEASKPRGRRMNFRRRFLTAKIMNERKVDTSKWTDGEFGAAWNVLVSSSQGRRQNSLPGNGKQIQTGNDAGDMSNHPMMR